MEPGLIEQVFCHRGRNAWKKRSQGVSENETFNLTISVYNRDLTVAGTATQFLYQGEKLPLVVVKDPRRRGDDLRGSYRFGVCFDGSAASLKALKVTLSLMADHDKIVVITCQEPKVDNSKITEDIRKACEPRRYEVVSIEREANHTIYQRIK